MHDSSPQTSELARRVRFHLAAVLSVFRGSSRIITTCTCGKTIAVATRDRGKRIRCRNCGRELVVGSVPRGGAVARGTIVLASLAYLAVVAALAVVAWRYPDRWPLLARANEVPRRFVLIPLAVLVPLALFARRWLLFPLGLAGVIVAAPVANERYHLISRFLPNSLSAGVGTIVFDTTMGGRVVTAEPTYDPATGHIVMQDNMDEYRLAVLMGEPTSGHKPRIVPNPSPVEVSQPVNPAANIVISPGRGGSGRALRMAYDGGNQHSANFLTLNSGQQPSLATHYFTYWARLNFLSEKKDVSLAVKWFMVWHVKAGNRVQWNLHDHLPWTGGHHLNYWQVYDQRETASQGDQPIGPYLEDVAVFGMPSPNQPWHRFTYAYRPNSAIGARDGFARMWIDGVKMIDVSRATAGVTPPGGEKVWCNLDDVDALAVDDPVEHLAWGATQTGTTPPWTYDIDDFMWWWTP